MFSMGIWYLHNYCSGCKGREYNRDDYLQPFVRQFLVPFMVSSNVLRVVISIESASKNARGVGRR